MIVKTFKDYLAQVDKKINKYNQTNYTKIELKNIEKLKNIIKDYLFKTEEVQRGENQYADLSNSIDIKNFKNYIDIKTSDKDLQCIEIVIKNISDVIIKNIIIDHILDRFSKLEKIICKEYNLETKNNELHFFDYDGSNTFIITNDKLSDLIKMINKK